MTVEWSLDDKRADFYRKLYGVSAALHLPTGWAQRRYRHAVRHANAIYWGEPLPESCAVCRRKVAR